MKRKEYKSEIKKRLKAVKNLYLYLFIHDYRMYKGSNEGA